MARDLQREVERFLHHEARLLDEWRLHEWLDLLTDDVHYWMPTRLATQGDRLGTAAPDEPALSLFNDDKGFLTKRVERFDTDLAHSERPPSSTRHLITNIEIDAADGDEVAVHSNFMVFQGRLDSTELGGYIFVGKREDRLREVDGQWRLADRKILLDQWHLPRTLSIWF